MRAVSFGARLSISLSSVVRMTASVRLVWIYKTLVSLSTEEKRNCTFAIYFDAQISDLPRLAYSISL